MRFSQLIILDQLKNLAEQTEMDPELPGSQLVQKIRNQSEKLVVSVAVTTCSRAMVM
jgi:hypothetical protein